jgi:3-oxoacyl-[acyl-carrier-protein] synthase-3
MVNKRAPVLSLPFASYITGTGSAFPPKILSNSDLATQLQIDEKWISERTGIKTRHISEPGRSEDLNSSLATEACKRALEMAKKLPTDIDAILVATCTPDTLIPSTACLVQKKLGAKKAWAQDLNAACSGFLFALAQADQMIRSGFISNALVVGSDVLSAFTNWQDQSSCILFGDGAGAVLLEATSPQSPHRIYLSELKSDGEHWDLFRVPAGGSGTPTTHAAIDQQLTKMQMKGHQIFREAVRSMSECAQGTLEKLGLTVDEMQWYVAHQANARILEAVASRLEISREKVLSNIEARGNTSAATIPTVIDQFVRNKTIQSGDWILMNAFGAGVTYGSLVLRW